MRCDGDILRLDEDEEPNEESIIIDEEY